MENTSQTQAVKITLPRARDLFKQSWHFYRENSRIALRFFLPPFVLLVIGMVFMLPLQASPSGKLVLTGLSTSSIVSSVFGLLLLIVGAVFSYVAIVAFMDHLFEKENGVVFSGIKNQFKKGFTLIVPFVWVAILQTSVVFGGFLLFIVPGIILSFYLTFSSFVLIDEKKRGLSALLQSWNYVKGYAPQIFSKGAFYGLVLIPFFILYIGLSFLVVFISGKFGVQAGEGSLVYTALQVIGRGLQQVVLVPLSIIYSYFIYKNLKNIKSQGINMTEDVKHENKRRNKLITLATIGALIVPGMIISIFFVSFKTARENAKISAVNVENATSVKFLPFEDKVSGIKMEYPEVWSSLGPSKEDTQVVASFQSPKNEKELSDYIEVRKYPLTLEEKNITLDQLAEGVIQFVLTNPGSKLIEKKAVTFAGNPGMSIQFETTFVGPKGSLNIFTEAVYTLKKGFLYGLIMSYDADPKTAASSSLLFGRILESFKTQ